MTASELKQALDCLYDPLELAQSQLCRCFPAVAAKADPQARAQALRANLLDAVEALHSPAAALPLPPAARSYELLSLHYVKRLTLTEAADELHVSRRQAYRDLWAALEKLAEHLEGLASRQPAATAPRALQDELARLPLLRQEMDLWQVMAGVVETVRPLAEARQVSLQLESAPEALSVAGEPALLRQLFLSLLSWAVRTSSGPRVAIAGCREGREAMVGLTFVPREAHPPLLPPEMAELCQVQRIRAGMEAAAGGRARLTLRVPLQLRRVVLVVEDNPGVVELYRRILEDTGGYEVVAAPAPAMAAALASELVPGAIILDILMPGQDGWIVLRSLKADTATRRIPVIVCSVFEEPELASALGAGAYLRKPISSQGLIETVERCLGGQVA